MVWLEMFSEYAGVRLLEQFLASPRKEIHLRQAAKLAGVSPGSAGRYLRAFHEAGLLERRRLGNLTLYRGNLENPAFRQLRVARTVFRLLRCGLVEHLVSEVNPVSVVLFGSAARGDDDETSDLDLLVVSKRRPGGMERFEERLGRKVNLIHYDQKGWRRKAREDRPFYESVVLEGVVLHGELPVI